MSRHLKPRTWKFRELDASLGEKIRRLQAETGLSPITLRVCLLRGLEDADAIREFLSPRLDRLTNPSSLKDMDRAVQRLADARTRTEKVRIFGDYDVDGTCGAALLFWVFREFGFESDVVQPDRFKDGYGLNVGAVEQAAADGVRLLVTVDCGITSFAAAQRARELGVDLIVLDHHQIDPERGLPPAVAVVNPQREDCPSQLKQLCGCGVAFYLCVALRAHGREAGWFTPGREPNLKLHLDLVVLATAADQVPLTGDNRVLVRHGLEVLKTSRKPGMRALLEVSGVGTSKSISPGHLGFVLGPRINASGRMQSASIALKLLTTEDPTEGTRLAHELERLNKERADLQNAIWDEVRKRAEEGIQAGKFKHGIVVADPGWHEGVVGIVASRVTETFRRPAVVIAIREDFGKGSVRSYGGRDVLEALRRSSALLLGFGGHRFAAGLSIDPAQVDAFAEAFDGAVGQLPVEEEDPPLWLEGECSVDELDVKTLFELEQLGPFGPGNPEPVFSIRAQVKRHQILRDRHLKLNLSRGDVSTFMEAIWFNAAESKDIVESCTRSHDSFQWAGVPELNRFRGRVTPTFRVKDWKRDEAVDSQLENKPRH